MIYRFMDLKKIILLDLYELRHSCVLNFFFLFLFFSWIYRFMDLIFLGIILLD